MIQLATLLVIAALVYLAYRIASRYTLRKFQRELTEDTRCMVNGRSEYICHVDETHVYFYHGHVKCSAVREACEPIY